MKRDARKNAVAPPLLGAMLRKARDRVLNDVFAALARAGLDDLHEAHMAVLQHPGPDGVGPLELARRAKMSKQAMNQLLGTLESAGYLVRQKDPEHGKQRIVCLTARGRLAIDVIRKTIGEIERDLERRIGVTRYQDFLACLREISDEREPPPLR